MPRAAARPVGPTHGLLAGGRGEINDCRVRSKRSRTLQTCGEPAVESGGWRRCFARAAPLRRRAAAAPLHCCAFKRDSSCDQCFEALALLIKSWCPPQRTRIQSSASAASAAAAAAAAGPSASGGSSAALRPRAPRRAAARAFGLSGGGSGDAQRARAAAGAAAGATAAGAGAAGTALESVDPGVPLAGGRGGPDFELPRHWREQLEKAPLGRRRVLQR